MSILNEVYFRAKNITKAKEGHFVKKKVQLIKRV